jgi:hypothetical protein
MDANIKLPQRLSGRPRDRRGYPIPYLAVVQEDGTPDFRISDAKRWVKVVNERRCALCGKLLGREIAFVGGPKSMAHRLFTDPGMHRDCAEYALKVCPFLAAPHFKYAESLRAIADTDMAVVVNENVPTERPEAFGLGITKGYDVQMLNGTPVIGAHAFSTLEWFHRGHELGPMMNDSIVCWG